MVINHLLNGMILQVEGNFDHGKWGTIFLIVGLTLTSRGCSTHNATPSSSKILVRISVKGPAKGLDPQEICVVQQTLIRTQGT